MHHRNSRQLLSHRLEPREVRSIARTTTSIHLIVHYPKTEKGKRELAERVAGVHVNSVNQTIQKLNCPFEQKVQLLNAVIETASIKKSGEQK